MDVNDKATSSIIDANFCLRGKEGGEGGGEEREAGRGKKEGRREKGNEGKGKRGVSLLVIIN